MPQSTGQQRTGGDHCSGGFPACHSGMDLHGDHQVKGTCDFCGRQCCPDHGAGTPNNENNRVQLESKGSDGQSPCRPAAVTAVYPDSPLTDMVLPLVQRGRRRAPGVSCRLDRLDGENSDSKVGRAQSKFGCFGPGTVFSECQVWSNESVRLYQARYLTFTVDHFVPNVVTRYGTLVGSCRSSLYLGRRCWIRDGRADFFHGQQTLLFYALG